MGVAVLVKLMRVAVLAPLVACVTVSVLARVRVGARAGVWARTPSASRGAVKRPPLLPLFVGGFLGMVALRSTGWVPGAAIGAVQHTQELLLAAALFALGSAVDLPSLSRTGARVAVLGLCAWVMIAGISCVGVLVRA